MNTEELHTQYDGSVTFTFGDSERLCNQLLGLIRSGKKTATCGALSEFGLGGDALPVVGRRDTALNWNGTPALLLATVEVFQMRFCDVDESFKLIRDHKSQDV
jgi:uncharacterized protein YhfF